MNNFRELPVLFKEHFPGKGIVYDVILGKEDLPVTCGEGLILNDQFIKVKEVITYADTNQQNSIIGIVPE
jgi:hypothetical protein